MHLENLCNTLMFFEGLLPKWCGSVALYYKEKGFPDWQTEACLLCESEPNLINCLNMYFFLVNFLFFFKCIKSIQTETAAFFGGTNEKSLLAIKVWETQGIKRPLLRAQKARKSLDLQGGIYKIFFSCQWY